MLDDLVSKVAKTLQESTQLVKQSFNLVDQTMKVIQQRLPFSLCEGP